MLNIIITTIIVIIRLISRNNIFIIAINIIITVMFIFPQIVNTINVFEKFQKFFRFVPKL